MSGLTLLIMKFQSEDMLMSDNFKKLCPINDEFSKIFDEICDERFNNLDLNCVLISIIDSVPADALPHLAEQYHITGNEGWLQAVTDEEKRALIKASIKMHRYKGTKYSLLEVLKAIAIEGEVSEWFEYGGLPYFFKMILTINERGLSPETEQNLRNLIDEYKNERSWLDLIRLQLFHTADEKTFSAVTINEEIIINAKEVI